MIVISAGMQKAGSGWYFNLTNDLLIAAGHQDVRDVRSRYHLDQLLRHENCSIGELTLLKLLRLLLLHFQGNTVVVKTHGHPIWPLRWLLQLGLFQVTYIYRDPRDSVLSVLDHGNKVRETGGKSVGFAKLDTLERAANKALDWLSVWDQWQQLHQTHPILLTRYEDLVADPLSEVQRLIDFLNLNVSLDVAKQIVAKYQPDAETFDESAEKLHFNQGISGRFQSVMDEHQLAVCHDYFGDYLARMGYGEFDDFKQNTVHNQTG